MFDYISQSNLRMKKEELIKKSKAKNTSLVEEWIVSVREELKMILADTAVIKEFLEILKKVLTSEEAGLIISTVVNKFSWLHVL